MTKPTVRPRVAHFSSGPSAKRPGWTPEVLKGALLGRSHRSKPGKAKLTEVVDRHRRLLGIPADYRLAIVPASDTGAVEMALWSLLGQRGVDVLTWDSFGSGWASDIQKELKIKDTRVLAADYGKLPDLKTVDWARDVVFTWNGTTAGVCVPDGDWIAAGRAGLSICDATSAVFAMALPWDKLDVTTWSWQKVLGGEAAHGMIALSPRAAQRLKTYTPPWPLPKIFRMAKAGKLIEGIFQAETINTPSMLCVEDALDALIWAESVGGLKGTIARSQANLAVVAKWVAASKWAAFMAENPATRSCTSICVKIVEPWFLAMDAEARAKTVRELAQRLETEGVALDIAGHRDAPAHIRIWGGATVEAADVAALLPWLDWAYGELKGVALKKTA
jgi:phosphoserine aminotransferase